MTIEFAIKGLVVAALVILAYWAFRRFQAPRPRTERLAMTVWAAFGPYDTAELSEKGLRWASRAVFGPKEIAEHENWILGHAENFRAWEVEGCFSKAHEMMRKGLLLCAYGAAFEKACQGYKDEAMADASQIIDSFNKDLEKSGHKMEPAKQPDGTYQVLLKKIWSDEEIERKDREFGEKLLNVIGNNLLEDQSPEAIQLRKFLGAVYQTNVGMSVETPKQVGIAWLACLEAQDKDPNSEIAKTFRALNNAWNANKCEIKTERLELHLSKDDFAKTAVQRTVGNIERVFSSEEACSGFTGARVIYKKGDKVIAEFRKYMLEKVQEIVTSQYPLISMRKALVDSLESYILNSAFWGEEFTHRRDQIYVQLNTRGMQLSDESAAMAAIWADTESLFLRMLQESMFEDVSKDDWWAKYSPLYEDHVKSLYRAALAKVEGNVDSMHAVMVKATRETIEKFKNQLFEGR